jgi:hypothetical protein
VNLIEVGKGIVKEDDTAPFLLRGGRQSAKSPTLSAKYPILRFLASLSFHLVMIILCSVKVRLGLQFQNATLKNVAKHLTKSYIGF